MAISQKIEVNSGDLSLESNGHGAVKGALVSIPFDTVASLADAVANTTVQGYAVVYGPHRLRGLHAAAATVAGTSAKPSVDVFVSTSSVMEAAKTLAVGGTVYEALPASPTTVRTSTVYTLRVVTAASDGALTALKANLLVEFVSTP